MYTEKHRVDVSSLIQDVMWFLHGARFIWRNNFYFMLILLLF